MAQCRNILDLITTELQHFQGLTTIEVTDVLNFVVIEVESQYLLQIDRRKLPDFVSTQIQNLEIGKILIVCQQMDILNLVLGEVERNEVFQFCEALERSQKIVV